MQANQRNSFGAILFGTALLVIGSIVHAAESGDAFDPFCPVPALPQWGIVAYAGLMVVVALAALRHGRLGRSAARASLALLIAGGIGLATLNGAATPGDACHEPSAGAPLDG